MITPLIFRSLIKPPVIAALAFQVTSAVALTPVLSATLLIFSTKAPRPLPMPVEITADVTPTSFTPSTFKNLRSILPIAVSSFELSKRVRPILSDVVAPILALTVWFE